MQKNQQGSSENERQFIGIEDRISLINLILIAFIAPVIAVTILIGNLLEVTITLILATTLTYAKVIRLYWGSDKAIVRHRLISGFTLLIKALVLAAIVCIGVWVGISSSLAAMCELAVVIAMSLYWFNFGKAASVRRFKRQIARDSRTWKFKSD